MSQPDHNVKTRTVRITNKAGLHARAATLVRNTVISYNAQVSLLKSTQRARAESVIEILSLCGEEGDTITLEAVGCDADAVLDALQELVDHKFYEDEFERPQESA